MLCTHFYFETQIIVFSNQTEWFTNSIHWKLQTVWKQINQSNENQNVYHNNNSF